MKLARKIGKPVAKLTQNEILAESVELDFENLRDWCRDKWYWIGVIVQVFDPDRREVGTESCWGIEDYTDYWKELAAEYINAILEKHARELCEREYWAARDVATTETDTVEVIR